jgi:PPP family 3-phenylpropionic acid transporter
MNEERSVAWLPIVGQYALHFGTVGILLPFLPAYLSSLSLSATEVGVLLAISPAMALFAPQLFGHLADRAGRADRVVRLIMFGSTLCFAPLAVASDVGLVALSLAGYAFFSTSTTSVLDSLALQRAAARGESFARIRLFGSAGFVVSSIAFGLAAGEVGRGTVLAPLALLVAATGWSFTLRARAPASPARGFLSGVSLLRRREVALLLGASCLHWIACAPYHGIFAIHVASLGLSPAVVGVGAGLGVLAEIVVMYLHPQLARRVTPRHLLAVAFAISAARWWGMSAAVSPAAIVALCLLHGFTFGAFYVGAVGALGARVPVTQRASGQALFVSITFGLGGLAGFFAAGLGYDALGGPRLFVAAAAVELVAAALILLDRD